MTQTIDENIRQTALEAGYKPEVYAQWVTEAKQQGVSIEDYIAVLDEDIVQAAKIESEDDNNDDDDESDDDDEE